MDVAVFFTAVLGPILGLAWSMAYVLIYNRLHNWRIPDDPYCSLQYLCDSRRARVFRQVLFRFVL